MALGKWTNEKQLGLFVAAALLLRSPGTTSTRLSTDSWQTWGSMPALKISGSCSTRKVVGPACLVACLPE